MQNKKSIVLSSSTSAQQKGILTLEEGLDAVRATLKLFNFAREVEGICSLGLLHDGKVDKAGLTQSGNMFFECVLPLKKIPSKFSVAVVNFVGGDPSPILFGSSQSHEDEIFAGLISELSAKPSMQKTKQVLDDFGVDFDEDEKATIESEIDAALSAEENKVLKSENSCKSDCENCVYKKFFFEENAKNSIFEVKNHEKTPQKTEFLNFEEKNEQKEEVETQENSKEKMLEKEQQKFESGAEEESGKDMFFNRLKPQIDKLFASNPAEENLQELIPSSKWVRVEFEDEGDFFVFGLLFDEQNNVKYVCYGVPSVFEQEPPEELSGFPIWLPLGESDGFGYWLTYQDAATGEPVKAIIS